jgi:hypothetical protein
MSAGKIVFLDSFRLILSFDRNCYQKSGYILHVMFAMMFADIATSIFTLDNDRSNYFPVWIMLLWGLGNVATSVLN